MIDRKKFKAKELNDDQLDEVTGGKTLTYNYIEQFKKMMEDSKQMASANVSGKDERDVGHG